MPREPREKSESGIYHIMLRGANKQEIFHDNEDCLTFLGVLKRYKVQSGMKVFGWCLMNNHAHLLVKEGSENISSTMKRIGVSYVHYYNSKYETNGHLFQDRFKSEKVESGRYLLTVIRYIHQNPVKAGMVLRVDEWKWSSCLGYYGMSYYPRGLLDQESVLLMFSDDLQVAKELFREFNERKKEDKCLEVSERRRLKDDEARPVIMERLGKVDITQVKSLPKKERNQVLLRLKGINGVSQRQAARILGISPNLFYKT